MPFTQKYAPQSTKEIIGQDEAVKSIKKQVDTYAAQKKRKALLLYGPTGTGKTSAIHALAKECDLELIEVNASDTRNSEGLEQKILPAIQQQSLFGRGKLILIDEIDGISGTSDRGGLPAIIKIIETSTFPIILTANDISDQKFSTLRKVCIPIEFKAISILEVTTLLKHVASKEHIAYDDDALQQLARISRGDIRAALNDFMQIASGTAHVTKELVNETGDREREEKIAQALLKIFKTINPEIALSAYEHIDEDIDKIFLWLDENLPKEYTKVEDIAQAYENLSQADIYFGRIRRWQYYRYYVYIYNFLSAGIALSKKERYPTSIEYKPSERILKIWIANQKHAKRKAIATKVAAKTHTSKRRALQSIEYIRAMYARSKDKTYRETLITLFELSDEEIEWLEK